MDIFESEAVRAIIEYSWPVTRKAIVRWMMIPSVAFLFFIILFTTAIYPIKEDCMDKYKDMTQILPEDRICVFNSEIS